MNRITAALFTTFLLTIFFTACKDSTSDQSTISDTPTRDSINTPTIETPVKKAATMYVYLDKLRLRETPGMKGKELARLPQDSKLTDLGEVSDFTTKLKIRGTNFDDPWIKVKTDTGLEGWVYGAGVRFDLNDPGELANKIMENRLLSIYGASVTRQIQTYQKAYLGAKDERAFSRAFEMGQELRDTIAALMDFKFAGDKRNALPDLSWLEITIPGYVVNLVEEGMAYALFMDYGQMLEKAMTTAGTADDDFMNINIKLHESDSIEYMFNSLILLTSEFSGHSLLGQGKHLAILKKMNEALATSDLFRNYIEEIKEGLVGDITIQGITYWEPQSRITKELEDILTTDLQFILSPEDRIAIQTRKRLFEDSALYKISVNNRSGE